MNKIRTFIIISILLWSCESDLKRSDDLSGYIPSNANLVVKISDFEAFISDVNKNEVLSKFDESEWYTLLKNQESLFKELRPSSNSVLAVSPLNDSTNAFTFITKHSPSLFVTDSIKDKRIETVTRDKNTYQRVILGSSTSYTKIVDSIFIASSSEIVLKSILQKNQKHDTSFMKLFTMEQGADVEILKRHYPTVNITDSTVNFATWSSWNSKLLSDGIVATGLVLAKDTVPQLLSVFKGQKPQQNSISKVVPTDAYSATAFTLNDSELLIQNLANFRGDSISEKTLFETSSEIGIVRVKDGNVIAIRSIDPSITQEDLAPYISEKTTFRDVVIYDFSAPTLFSETFYPFISETDFKIAFQLDDFFIFSETEEIANQLIIAFKNNDVLEKTTYFEDTSAHLSRASSLIHYELNGSISGTFSSMFLNKNSSEKLSVEKYPIIALQLIYDRDFAHTTFIGKEISGAKKNISKSIESINISTSHEILGNPQFFSNHKTKGQDVVFQDITNTLHLYSINGKKLWSKLLDGPILGKINEVDILRNGKKQMAFTTQKTLYLLDRNGNNVEAFPIKFKDDITQPLAVFDYDNNRKYRLLITQDEEVYMYDSKGKSVRGFTFKKAKSKIVQPPKHIRMSNKDYILIAEENGTLNILSRTGKSRVTVNKSFDFSEIPITKEGTRFVVITKDYKKVSISQDGNVSDKKLDVSPSYWFSTSGILKVTMDDNLLRVNGKLVELPLGIYTKPRIYLANRTTYITITETQENKVYVVNKNGTLLPKFPLYGTSEAVIENTSRNLKPALITKGDDKEILIYKF